MSGPDFQPPGSSGQGPPPGQGPPQGWQGPPPGGQGPPPGWQGPPNGGQLPPGWQGSPNGRQPPPGRPPGTPWQPPGGLPPRSGGSILLGILVGLIVLFGGGWLSFAVADRLPGDVGSILGTLLPLAYIAGSIVLAVRTDTRRFGAGLLLAIGAALVILAGVCFGLLFMMASQ